jgi:hypothetical protein
MHHSPTNSRGNNYDWYGCLRDAESRVQGSEMAVEERHVSSCKCRFDCCYDPGPSAINDELWLQI